MASFLRSSARVAQQATKQQPRVFRRGMASGGHDHSIPGVDGRAWILKAAAIAFAGGLLWKNWQWNDKARRVEANQKWEKYWPKYAARVKAELEAADAAELAESDEQPDLPVAQPPNVDRPESSTAHADSPYQQPQPLEKAMPGKRIVSKENQEDI